MPKIIESLINVGEQAAGVGMGLLLGKHNDERQFNQQAKLQQLQLQGNKEMTDYNMMKQLEMWRNTSYPAQIEMMKKAGLNPGLIYGMSGGGGQTTGSATGNVQGASAPQGGREIQDIMGLQIQRELLQAQKENIQADTQNKLADVANKPLQGNVLKAQEKDLLQGVENKKQQELFQRIQNRMAEIDELYKKDITDSTADQIYWNMRKAREEFQIAEQEAWLNRELRDEKQKIMEANTVEAALRVEAAKQGIKLTDTQIQAVKEGIRKGWSEYDLMKWAKEQEATKMGITEALIRLVIGGAKQIDGQILKAPQERPK